MIVPRSLKIEKEADIQKTAVRQRKVNFMRKIAVIPHYFEPTEEFALLLRGRRKEIMYDEDIISYIESHGEKFNGRMVCKGRSSDKFRIGFSGCAEILEVDDTKKWILQTDRIDRPYIVYVNILVDEAGLVKIQNASI